MVVKDRWRRWDRRRVECVREVVGMVDSEVRGNVRGRRMNVGV